MATQEQWARILGQVAPAAAQWGAYPEEEKYSAKAVLGGYKDRVDDLYDKLKKITYSPETIRDVIEDDPWFQKNPGAKEYLNWRIAQEEGGAPLTELAPDVRTQEIQQRSAAMRELLPLIREGGISPEAQKEIMEIFAPALAARKIGTETVPAPIGVEPDMWGGFMRAFSGEEGEIISPEEAARRKMWGEELPAPPERYQEVAGMVGGEWDEIVKKDEEDLAVFFTAGPQGFQALGKTPEDFIKKYPVLKSETMRKSFGIPKDITEFSPEQMRDMPFEEKAKAAMLLKRVFRLSDATVMAILYNWVTERGPEEKYQKGIVPQRFW